MIYATIQGLIVNQKIKTPEEGKPHNALYILQDAPDETREPQLVKVKDYDLARKYDGKEFAALCSINDWSFDGKSGQAATVLKVYGNGKKV